MMGEDKGLMAALGEPDDAEGESEMLPDDDGMQSAKEGAAADAMAAMKADDAVAFSEALTRFYDACQAGPGAVSFEGEDDGEL